MRVSTRHILLALCCPNDKSCRRSRSPNCCKQNTFKSVVEVSQFYCVSSIVASVESAYFLPSSSPLGISASSLYPIKKRLNSPAAKSSCFRRLKSAQNHATGYARKLSTLPHSQNLNFSALFFIFCSPLYFYARCNKIRCFFSDL